MKYGEMAFRTGEGIISTTAWTGDVSCVGYGAILKQLRESGYNKTSVTEEVIPVVPLLNTVPLYAGTVRAICDCGDHAWGIIADCDSELKCLQYRDELFRAGFTSVTERSICGNRFLKVRGFGCDVRLQYFPSDESMRILVSGTEPDVQGGKGDGDKFDSVTVVQIGLGVDITSRPISRDTASVSMSYVIRLSDGSFIVYDGGLKLKEYAERLLRTLNRLTPDGKPRIAAWILTHPHPDHTGVLEYFAENPEYRDAVDVELFISNFPSDIQVAGESEDLPAYQNAVKKCMDFFPSAKKIKPFTGDILFIHGVELEVLYSQEVFLPTHMNDLNASSLVTRLTAEGCSLLFPADHSDQESAYQNLHFNKGAIRKIWGTYLKSDFVQVCHHGLGGGGTNEFYETVGAKYVFWPIGAEKYHAAKLGENPRNMYFKKPNVKTFYAFGGVQVCRLRSGKVSWKEYPDFNSFVES